MEKEKDEALQSEAVTEEAAPEEFFGNPKSQRLQQFLKSVL